MEVVIDFEFLRGRQNEIVVKKLSVAAAVSETFRFKSPYNMASQGSDENRLNWEDGHIAYHELYTFASESVAGFDHLYAYVISKCKLLTQLLGRPILNLQDFNFPLPKLSIINTGVACLVTNFLTSIAKPKPRTHSTIG